MSKPAIPTSIIRRFAVTASLLCLLCAGVATRAFGQTSQDAPAVATLTTQSYVAKFSTVGAGLVSFKLMGDRYLQEGAPLDMVTTDRAEFAPLSFELKGAKLESKQRWQILPNVSPDTEGGAVRLGIEVDGLRIVRKYTAGKGPYQLWVTTRVDNLGERERELSLKSKTFHYAPRSDEEGPIPLLPVRSPWLSHGVCLAAEEIEREDRSSLTESPLTANQVVFVATENIYFLSALASHEAQSQSCHLTASDRGRDPEGEPLGTLFESTLERAPVKVAPKGHAQFTTLAYFGPKTPEALAAAGHQLSESIDGGWFSALAKLLTLLLRLIHDILGNWGFAIILLTFIVKAALYPLTAKQMTSMGRMKELKPEMDRINELYKDDSQGKGAAMMELYREKGVNPMAGCLPMLVQLPIWFSLYASLSSNVELFHAPFVGWLADLSSPDPFFVLPIALGALMFLQQKMTPATGMDPAQQKMMLYMMPSMMMAFMLFLPAGLCLYMFTNSALSIGQQRLIETKLAKSSASSGGSTSPLSSPDSNATTDASSGETSLRTQPTRPSKAERRSRRGK